MLEVETKVDNEDTPMSVSVQIHGHYDFFKAKDIRCREPTGHLSKSDDNNVKEWW